eukprot:CAMPEP_0184482458 /NCGR_PEP_ID=MMETSP0113_2-20130426/4020_1 /TAXON_ID=91329 /ORGANISM="Norrisiella sphaerica, Strain BC52" /LENGTH=190 /DNA_ID=CAMNT_0026862187 /DNA_START=195 /DNA_END=767 /DNA_ORIENTATION=-
MSAEGKIEDNDFDLRGCSQECTARAWKQIKFSKMYIALALMLSILCFTILVWELAGHSSRHWLPLACEGFVNTVLVLDVILDIISQGFLDYFSKALNVLDFFVTIFCVTLFVGLLARQESAGVYDSELSHLDIIFLILRYLLMVLRVWVLFNIVKRGTDALGQDEVNFSKIKEDEAEEESETDPLNTETR